MEGADKSTELWRQPKLWLLLPRLELISSGLRPDRGLQHLSKDTLEVAIRMGKDEFFHQWNSLAFRNVILGNISF